MTMKVKIDSDGPFPIVRLSGEFQEVDAEEFADSVHELVAGQRAKLAIDLSALDSINSSGLSALITSATRARLGGGRVVLVAPTPFVGGVFNVTKLDTWFDICPDMTEAATKLELE